MKKTQIILGLALILNFAPSYANNVSNISLNEIHQYIEENVPEEDFASSNNAPDFTSSPMELSTESLFLNKFSVDNHEIKESKCYLKYREDFKRLRTKTLLGPLFGIAGSAGTLVAGTFIGSYLGEIITGSSGWGSIIGSAWGSMIGFGGGIIYFSVKEFIIISQLIDNLRMEKVLNEVYLKNENKLLTKLVLKFKKEDIETSPQQISDIIKDFDQGESLCNGELTGKMQNKKLHKRLVGFKGLYKAIKLKIQ